MHFKLYLHTYTYTYAFIDLAAKLAGLWCTFTLPYLTFGVGRLLHLPSAEAISVRPNAQPRCNQKVTVISCEAEQITSHLGLVTCSVVVPVMRSTLCLLLSFRLKNRPGRRYVSPTTTPRWQTSVGDCGAQCTLKI